MNERRFDGMVFYSTYNGTPEQKRQRPEHDYYYRPWDPNDPNLPEALSETVIKWVKETKAAQLAKAAKAAEAAKAAKAEVILTRLPCDIEP